MASQHIEDALLLLRAEYLDMPGPLPHAPWK